MPGKTFVTLGPSLSYQEANTILPDAIYLPPIKCGDLLHLLRLKPARLLIIDGFFENAAAVWHKEILYAIEQGVEIYGASSMGALRAAELHTFQMQGIGEIYEQYATGTINDDDEVAILHQPEEFHFKPVTDAMVNIRFTIQQALIEDSLCEEDAAVLLASAKSLCYKERTLQRACEMTGLQYMSKAGLVKFKTWLDKGGYVDQKKRDAITALKLLNNNKSINELSLANLASKTVLLRTLNKQTACEPFYINRAWLPLPEKVCIAAKKIPELFPLLQRLSYLLATVYEQTLQTKLSTHHTSAFAMDNHMNSMQWRRDNDCSDEDYDAMMTVLTSIQAYIQTTPDNDKTLFNDLLLISSKLSGIYASINPKSIDDLLLAQQETATIQYKLLTYIAQLWQMIIKTNNKHDTLSADYLKRHSEEFRHKKQLTTKESLEQWMLENDLDQMAYAKLIATSLQFEHFIFRNNIELKSELNKLETHHFLLYALRITGTYPLAKQLIE